MISSNQTTRDKMLRSQTHAQFKDYQNKDDSEDTDRSVRMPTQGQGQQKKIVQSPIPSR